MDTSLTPRRPSHNSQPSRIGLVLAGGGARGAYQAGVLQGIAEILGTGRGDRPFFDIITGISAGAINAAYVASKANRPGEGIAGLFNLWSNLTISNVMRTDAISFVSIGSRWIWDLSLGGMMASSGVRSNHLIDATPLGELLGRTIDFAKIESLIDQGLLDGFAVSATNYNTGTVVTFFDAHDQVATWTRSARLGRRSRIQLKHILASASIPILFRPIPVDGANYGDGGIRMATPLSPAIHLGADRVLAVSVRHLRSGDSTAKMNLATADKEVSIADIAGVLLNAAFMDGLDSDAERMARINQTIELMTEEQRLKHPHKLRHIPLLVIRPSVDIGTLASEQLKRFPAILRYALRGLGASEERGADFISYLAFDPAYIRPLLEIGRKDALEQKGEIESFILADSGR